ncbi:PPE domain-containing protein [Saccharothrix texasensis]|uniref:PPE family protein n=1 Tax=Saccharothrix texasensis TaxID=103734 RepID=A0A3N1HAQ1_9PSEU|nr:PPE domain-containing protein [Saccharothrix texasensis]ROP39541.1 PPE family protein [Saccharothrix texasensis]
MGFRQITDHRFEGYSNTGLAELVGQFQTGDAAQRFSDASHALRQLASTLDETDQALRTELKKLGIDWRGAAGDNAGQAVTVSADTATSGTEAGQTNSKATAVQGANYSQARNGMPEPQQLRGASETNLVDDVGGFFGYETDHAKEVKETQAAREQAIRGLDQYTEASRDALNQYQGMNRPPQFDVTAASSVSTPVASVGLPGGPTPGIPGGVPGGVPGGSTAHLPGGGTVGLPPQVPGQLPGGSTGLLPTTPGGQTVLPPAALGGKPGGSNFGLGLGLGLAGGLGLGLAATQARGGRVVRNTAPAMPGGGKAPEGHAGGKGTGGGAGGKGGVPGMPGTLTGKPGVSATIGAIDPDERVHGRGAAGAAAGKGGAGSSMLQPAASAKGGEGEEDGEHVRKYGVDSDDVFGDERMVVQSVIGDESEKK